jgi:hypothetical protein
VVELREVNTESAVWVHGQEVVHLADAAVLSLVTRGVAGIQNDVSDALVFGES